MNIEDAMEIVRELHEDEGAGDPEAMINISPELLFALEAEVFRLHRVVQQSTDQNLRVLKAERAALNKLTRVEALPEKWKARLLPTDDRWVHAALELENALRDLPCIAGASTDAALAAPKSSDEQSTQ
jgi:hypothetical protein